VQVRAARGCVRGDARVAEAPAATAPVGDPAACRIVRLSDIGWTDVTATTALFAALIWHLGCRPEITVLSLPVTYASMKNKDIDVFLGNWMPSQGGDRKSYVADGSVEVIRANLTGANYTLAVPACTNDAGLRSFADIQRYAAQLNNSIVFLAWDPHPMNMRFDLRFLSAAGVTTFDGRPAVSAMGDAGKLRAGFSLERWLSDHKIPVGDSVAAMIEYVKTHGRVLFDGVSALIRGSVDGLTALLRVIPSPLLILGAAALSWVLRRSLPLAAFVVAALLFIMNQGYWEPTLETLSLVIAAALVSTAIGVPVGIAAAHRPRLYAALRPVLDLMQTLPTFVYLIPTLVLFGLGVVPGLISTVIFALPAPIRLTQLGISSVPRALLEAGQAFGATPMQLLWKVELPSAAPTILAGITQCIMLSLSMVVIAALVGAGGLGVPVVRALSTVQVGMGFEAGFVIVLLAIVLDRISRPADKAPTP
jgi:glycine betaine/proline transport system permease protein